MEGSLGSIATRRTPRGEQGVPPFASVASPVQNCVVSSPLWTNVKVAPPSVDL